MAGELASFMNAPVSKASWVLVLGASVLTSALKAQSKVDLRMSKILRGGELWRLVTSQLAFQDHGQTFSSLILLYTFRHVERQMGSRKFSSFVVVTSALATTLEMVASLVFQVTPAAGPYGVIYSMFVLYYATVPKLHPRLMGMMGVDLSDKALFYILGLQLLLCRKWESILPATCGIIAGALWRSDALYLNRITIPSFICKCFSVLGPILNPRRQRRRPAPGAAQNGPAWREQLIPGGFGGGGGGFQVGARAPPREPPEEAVQLLMGMGFGREQVVRALQSTGNNVEMAANRLLTTH